MRLSAWKSISYISKFVVYPPDWRQSGGIFDYDVKRDRLTEVIREIESNTIWNTPDQARALGRERSILSFEVFSIDRLSRGLSDATELLQLASDEQDLSVVSDLSLDIDTYRTDLEDLEFRRMFNGEMDSKSAYLEIQAGAGGMEAQDWARMLLRMYLRWAEKHGFEVKIMDYSPGEGGTLKGATVHIIGDYAYGWLRTEMGVHRLVRKSPFDAGNRRHTSFGGVSVSPEIDDGIEINITAADLRIDTYRSSGAGGQHVNTTDSAVRITHLPSGTVVTCQSERSQHSNKDTALRMLRAKLFEAEMQARREAAQARQIMKANIGWSNQIRSYVLDASRIKDIRTSLERSDCDAVLDGDIDEFLIEALKQRA